MTVDVKGWSAIDFKYRYEEAARWFDALPVYNAMGRLTYPPATYARLLWGVSTIAAMLVIAAVAYRGAERGPGSERLLIALLVFASFPVQLSILLGQLSVHAVACAAAGTLVLTRGRGQWASDGAGAALLAASLIKPTLTPPIVAAVLIGVGRWRPALLSGGIYAALALAGAAAQPAGIVALHRGWLDSNATRSLAGEITEGLPNLHLWLAWVGREGWAPTASLIVLIAFAAWAWRRRRADPWVLVGAGAVVARLWAYHRAYDDVVLILAAIALLRMTRADDVSGRLPAALILAGTLATLLTPGWLFYETGGTLGVAIQYAHAAYWVLVLGFFLTIAGRSRPAPRIDHDARPAALGAR
jgi:hypothetical protein